MIRPSRRAFCKSPWPNSLGEPPTPKAEREIRRIAVEYADTLKSGLSRDAITASVKKLANRAGIYATESDLSVDDLEARSKLIVAVAGWVTQRYADLNGENVGGAKDS